MSLRTPAQPSATSAYDVAVALLTRAPLAAAELKRRLSTRGFDDDDIATSLERLRQRGYLDDSSVVELIGRRAAREHRGPAWIEIELERRGLAQAQTQTQDLLRRAHASADADARTSATAKFGPIAALDAATRARALRYLMRRGFPEASCRAALDLDEAS